MSVKLNNGARRCTGKVPSTVRLNEKMGKPEKAAINNNPSLGPLRSGEKADAKQQAAEVSCLNAKRCEPQPIDLPGVDDDDDSEDRVTTPRKPIAS